MFSFKSIYFVIFTLILCKTQAEISDRRLCIDENCSETISIGKTLIRYASPEENVLSFAPNEDVKVFSYGAGTRPDLVGVEIKGKRGYINKIHFKETKLFKRPKLLVNTELVYNKPEVPLEGAAAEIKADPTQEPFEIIDGTRIPLDVASSSTESPVLSEQNSGETTKPLHSVPNNQNVNPAAPGLPNIVSPEEQKNIDNSQQQQQLENVNTEDEDSEDDEDDDDDDDPDGVEAEDDEEKEQENKNTEAPNELGTTKVVDNAVLSENSNVVTDDSNKDDAAAMVGASNDDFKSKEANLEPQSNNNLVNETINIETNNGEAINVGTTTSSEDPPNEKLKKATPEEEKANNVNENVQSSQSNEPSSSTLDPSIETKIEGFVPLVNIVSAIQKPEAEKLSQEVSDKDLKKDAEQVVTDNAENIKKEVVETTLNETKQPQLAEEEPSLPPSVTERPIDIGPVPPVDLDVVTPNPFIAGDERDSGDSKNYTEDNSNSSYSLPSNLMPEFKDPEEGADIKVEKEAGGSLFDGLKGILPIFNSGDDREVSEESTSLGNNENGISDDNNQPLESENIIVDDISVSPKQDDFPNNLEQNDEFAQSENASTITEHSDLPPNLNSETFEQNSVEEAGPVVETPSDNQSGWSRGVLSNIMSFFSREESVAVGSDENQDKSEGVYTSSASDIFRPEVHTLNDKKDFDTNPYKPSHNIPQQDEDNKEFCFKENCPKYQEDTVEVVQEKNSRRDSLGAEDLQILFIEAFSSDLFLYLTTTALSVIFLVFGMVILDKCRREGPLIARINKLEQQLLTTVKENEMLQERSTAFVEEKTQLVIETVPNEVVEELNQKLAEMDQIKLALEEQIQALEKELDTSTEVGIELNKIITEMLNSSDGSEIIKENIEQMQKKLLEQQDTINTMNETLSFKETENHELRLEMEISNRKVADLQSEMDRLVDKILRIEEERDQQHSTLENEIVVYQTKCKDYLSKEQTSNSEIQVLKQQLTKFQRLSEVKIKEYNTLKESLNEIKDVKNNKDVLKSLLEVSEIKAQLEQLKSENIKYAEQLTREKAANVAYGTEMESLTREVNSLREKYEKADKEKVEINTKLEVLNNYFKEKEDQMQKEISKYESLWAVKKGEATSTTERIRYMQEELQNYKSQNDSLKQEIVNQEVELKSQISMLEKKSHESWVANRQTERKLEEARQEAALLRNRLTLRERAIADGNHQARMQSPLHQNGELPMSPPPMDPTLSPPPLFNPRDHLAKSPPIPGMPPPFLPPPLGATPFMPPPPLDGMIPPMGDMGGMPPPHFMPPLPPGMFPGDHRPPPLGRMSSPPPVGGRYTPESTAYSDYDRYSRRSPSPPYDSEYGASPPPIRGYSPYQDRLRDDRRDYKRPQARSNGRNSKGIHSSGSENDSLGKINKKPQRKV